MERLLTVNEVAEMLHCHPQTVYRLANARDLPHLRPKGIGLRFHKANIDEWLGRGLVKPIEETLQLIDNKLIALKKVPSRAILNTDGNNTGGTGEMAKAKCKSRYNFGFGAIYQRKISGGKIRWYLDYRASAGKRVQKVVAHAVSKEDAALALREELARVLRQDYGIASEAEPVSFRQMAQLYIDNYAKANKKSWLTDEFRLRNLLAFFGDYQLKAITPLLVEKFKASRLDAGNSKSTVNRYLALLKIIFRLAADWGYGDSNPLRNVKLFSEKDTQKERYLTDAEEKTLLECSTARLRPIILFALHTGMRRGEILSLKWADVDLSRKVIRVERAKNGRTRFLPINRTLSEVLEGLRNARGRESLVFPYQSVRTAFENACKKAKLAIRFHDLRHTFATRLVEKGVDLITVQHLLGHHSVTMTQRYTHSSDDRKMSAVQLLASAPEIEPQKGASLLHSRDTKTRRTRRRSATSDLSVN
jgi:excisionase family DNA binding protein